MTVNTVHLEELPYRPDSCGLFQRIRGLPGALLLDSCYPPTLAGRFDIMTADPAADLSFRSELTTSYDELVKHFREIVKVHSNYCSGLVAPAEDIPFCGGVAGYLDYGSGKPLQHLPDTF